MTHFHLQETKETPNRLSSYIYVKVSTAKIKEFIHNPCGVLFFTEKEWKDFQVLLNHRSDNLDISPEQRETDR